MFEVHVLPVADGAGADRRFVLYRPRAGLAFVGNRAMAELAVQLARGGPPAPGTDGAALSFLDQVGFLAPDPPLPEPDEDTFTPTTAVLLLTNQCQLRCRYCYASAGEGAPAQLELDHARAAIDHVAATAARRGADQFEVSFHGGGEPTRAWRLLRECVHLARSQPVPAHVTLTSNGIWSLRQLDWLVQHVNGLTVSIDGGPATQNAQRPFPTGRGSLPVVLRNLADLDRRGVTYGVRMTAVAPWTQLAEDVRFLCENTECRNINVEPAFNVQRGGHARAGRAQARTFVNAFLRASGTAARAGRWLTYSGARVGSVANSYCSAPYEALIVAPGGDVVSCYEVTSPAHPLAAISTLGRVTDGEVVIDERARRRLHGLVAARQRRCRGCCCRRSCAGDCYVRGFTPGERGHLTFGTRCLINRELTKGLLLQLIADGGGVWRLHPGGETLRPGGEG